MAYFTDPLGSEFRKALDDVLRQIELEEEANKKKSENSRKKSGSAKPSRLSKRKSVARRNLKSKKPMNRLSEKTRKELR
jgi:hypothetical protein